MSGIRRVAAAVILTAGVPLASNAPVSDFVFDAYLTADKARPQASGGRDLQENPDSGRSTFPKLNCPDPVTVMIDPGHGGKDAGALGLKETPKKKGAKAPERLVEKKVVLQLARLLGDYLRDEGCEVHYTRVEDTMVPLLDRARAANDIGADIFVSLHMNAHPDKSARGSEVFFLSLEPVDKELQALADAENEFAAPARETDILAGILEDLAQKAYLHESERMAVYIQTELNCLAGIKERGVKQAPFAVLRTAAMPAVLVEVVFISNPSEAAKLRDPAFLKSAAQAIARGIQHYIESTGNNRTRRKPSAP